MPTDPFVSPDLDDRPRQQQNLPPGVGYPPAGHWRADRPGDLPPGQPRGPLLGAPGPNVGYAYTLAERAKDRFRLADHEHLDDAVAVVAEIAGRRSTLFRRAPVVGDVDVAVALLGYDGNADPEFAEIRHLLVHGAHHEYTARRAVVDSVPEELLRRPAAELGAHIDEWRRETTGRLRGDRPSPA